jgi:hypothetical protein
LPHTTHPHGKKTLLATNSTPSWKENTACHTQHTLMERKQCFGRKHNASVKTQCSNKQQFTSVLTNA